MYLKDQKSLSIEQMADKKTFPGEPDHMVFGSHNGELITLYCYQTLAGPVIVYQHNSDGSRQDETVFMFEVGKNLLLGICNE